MPMGYSKTSDSLQKWPSNNMFSWKRKQSSVISTNITMLGTLSHSHATSTLLNNEMSQSLSQIHNEGYSFQEHGKQIPNFLKNCFPYLQGRCSDYTKAVYERLHWSSG
jgi:hypothetical protein